MVDVASYTFKLQSTIVVMHEEVFCIAGPPNPRKGVCNIRGFQCIPRTSGGGASPTMARRAGV
jgi:hypothetical protein